MAGSGKRGGSQRYSTREQSAKAGRAAGGATGHTYGNESLLGGQPAAPRKYLVGAVGGATPERIRPGGRDRLGPRTVTDWLPLRWGGSKTGPGSSGGGACA